MLFSLEKQMAGVTSGPSQTSMPSNSQGEKDMYGHDKFDKMGLYIPQYDLPGGAIPANFGNPAYDHWESTKTVDQYGYSVKDNESSCGWSPVVVDVVRYRSNFVLDHVYVEDNSWQATMHYLFGDGSLLILDQKQP